VDPVPDVQKIGVLRANSLGDYLFTLPALDALRAAYGDAEIVLLGAPWHARELAGRPGPVDRVLVAPRDRIRSMTADVERSGT
jgi:ADP-heptose:LPS heptosyltransferase